jgi:hypothetical protein
MSGRAEPSESLICAGFVDDIVWRPAGVLSQAELRPLGSMQMYWIGVSKVWTSRVCELGGTYVDSLVAI